jgi:murein DD-endopeptidase MepM/ murein hydrolase activator NlpD
MAKVKYKFDPKDLSYKEINSGFKERVLNFLPHFLGSVFTGIILYAAFTWFFDSPKVKALKRENTAIVTQYKLLSQKIDNLSKVLKDLEYRDDNLYRTIFEAEPIPSTVREAGIGGVDRYEKLEGFKTSDIVIKTSKKLDKIAKQIYIQSKSYDEITELAKNKEQLLKCIPAILPVDIKNLTRISGYFGYRLHPILKYMRMHDGMDFTAPTGTKVYAAGDGIVEEVKLSRSGYGNKVVINHGFSYETVYAHLSKILVKEGDKVTRGTVIGLIGNTGLSTGPHLHYEVRKKGKAVDPINYFSQDITPEQYDEMIYRSSHEGGQSMD